MRIGILSNEGSWYYQELQRACQQQGHECKLLDFESLGVLVEQQRQTFHCGELPAGQLEAIIVRSMPPGSLEQVIFRMNLLAQLEQAGILILNSPRSLECAIDKYLTTSKLQQAGLPVPRTAVCENSETAMQFFETLNREVVVKPLFGSEGRGILRLSDPDLAFRTFRTLERTESVLYLQEFIPHDGFDLRGLVLNGKMLGGMKRIVEEDFRTNIAREGRAVPYNLSNEEQTLCLKAAETIGANFAGVDLLYGPEGNCYVLEVNGVPGWRAFQRVTGIDVALEVIQELARKSAT